MKVLKLPLLFVLLIMGVGAGAQKRVWGKLIIPVSDAWSIKQKNGVVELSNYSLHNAEPFTISLFENKPYTGKADSLFALAWRTFVNPSPASEAIPRWRRFYTEEGILIQQGFIETNGEGVTSFRQLNVFLLNDSYQACLLETSTGKNYKLMQTEWMERLQGIVKVPGVKSK